VIVYLTYNDSPSGIYSSQVIDVVKFLSNNTSQTIRLVSLISIRSFFVNRKKIKAELPDSIVLPMFPKMKYWQYNYGLVLLVSLFLKPHTIIGRSVLATQLALKLKKSKNTERVIYDGRGAIAAEWKEYKVVQDPEMLGQIFSLEKEAVLLSDFRIAVSQKLVSYWLNEFGYVSDKHVIIPCTINKMFESTNLSEHSREEARKSLRIESDDVLFIYSGSVAGWQSFDILSGFILPLMTSSFKNKILFLSEFDSNIEILKKKFPDQVIQKKVKPHEVAGHLIAGDYGLLLREQSITNAVASPVKFAEYLACGLDVIISENLGDYTQFVLDHKCGSVLGSSLVFTKKDTISREFNSRLALNSFKKETFKKEYGRLFI
jgi:hypothetical protein